MSISLLLFLLASWPPQDAFRAQQRTHARVRQAYAAKETYARQLLAEKGIATPRFDLLLRAFKQEQTLEIWAKANNQSRFTLLTTLPFCASSGGLGPKRRAGDGQIPEGFYTIDRFNPASNFYLSLGLNYPNAADRQRSTGDLGGDIFVHGGCVTIGCIPLTDDKIQLLYLLAVEARAGGQTAIPVHIYPARLTPANLATLTRETPALSAFWANLQTGYAAFERSHTLFRVRANGQGAYRFD